MNLKNLLQPIAILALFAVILFQRCGHGPNISGKPDTISVKSDTVWVIKKDTIQGKDRIVLLKSEPIHTWDTFPVYKPDTTYPKLLSQYESLGNKYFTLNTYKQTYPLDSLGDVTILDSINQNRLVGSSLSYSLRIPKVTNTITIQEPYKPKNQVYLGGGIFGSQTSLVSGFEAGALLKNKKDQIYLIKAQIDTKGQINYGIGTYFKLSFGKK